MIRDKQKAFVILEGLRAYEFFKPVDLRGLKGSYSKEELLGKMPDDEFEHYLKLLEGEGFIRSTEAAPDGKQVFHLTWKGHDLAEELEDIYYEDEEETDG
ncbi:hypothetical protein ACE6HY_18110 [Pseudomonas aeruginosa]|uniref:hypothetical protein n=1 Tax=Pseudomonas aeruginosa TaxID=287 RepID=UPI000EB40902|nr:hypothetical protein [Pseudomonas aeruginosa]RTU38018.1 hypothetical protein DY973_10675 [Pseudomonas aeruginosa]HDU8922513.1 hypothetical protein [Pseudomonas aeruginosa]HDU9090509.1 hypothetical protein [Pseudomonas aeruginosa]